jgi:Flp pilus assembly protein TadG
MRQRVMTAMTSSMPRAFRRFGRDRRGVSAVEFAFIAPVMIGLYLGCVEVSEGVAADRKVSLIAGALANLTAQVNPATISTADMTNILNASSAIIAPYSAGNLKMTVSCLSIDANKNVTVKWSETMNGTKRTSFAFDSSNSALTVASPSSYPISLIYSEVTYAYTPTVGYTISGTLTLSDKMFMSPRLTPPVYNGKACT